MRGHYPDAPLWASAKPTFFIQGERDVLCPLKEMQEFYARRGWSA